MPILDLPEHSPQIAYCVMVMAAAYPDEPQHHHEFLKASLGVFDDRMIKNGLVDPAEDWQFHSELAQAVAAMPLRLKTKLARKDKGRRMAAELLLTTLSLHRHAPRVASLETAIDLIQQRNKDIKRATSRAAMLAAWARYKSVAHILAAFELREAEMVEIDKFFDDDSMQSLEDLFAVAGMDGDGCEKIDLVAFLADVETEIDRAEKMIAAMEGFVSFAQQIGRDATQAFSHGQKKQKHPLVKAKDLWLLPAELKLPPVTIDYPPLSAEDRRRLGL